MAKGVVTSGQVAKLAKVSQSAVSRTFTPGASVSEDIRKRVMAAAEQLGYRPNLLAKAVNTGRSRLIAVLVAYLDNHFYPVALEELSRALQAQGYQVLLFMTERGNQDQLIKKVLQYRVEGIVMASAEMSSGLAQECVDTGIPVVLFNRYVPESLTSSVVTDNLSGARRLTRLLIDAGHERIAFIAGSEDSSTNKDREAGFRAEMSEAGLDASLREVGNYTMEGAAEATRRLFASRSHPDAIFVANDHMAFGVIDVIRDELRLRVPEDVSVVGFDDVPEASWKGYRLTTVRQPVVPMIKATVDILMAQISSNSVETASAVIASEIIVRGSARLPRLHGEGSSRHAL
ncbi:LacI family DNA-binding transcriptional regulator [Rhizobium sp. BK176]|uniref:LacI family DNA-binding transcriptional regulator n=1 Tax=Rhizobium sp. BK176 TaxID=2587071 RepID=UPI002168893C|nr:LacI family DNA-binding transcriptional regulator [Rhizobium sp. BK176]MCS4096205.1 DNA-binding LacI/PurR family transcriptional regulator [Rhizobium sp. BK176]